MLALFAVGIVLVACADSDEVDSLGGPSETDSGGVTTLPEASAPADAGAEDADADASVPKDAETDAPARICSDENFCHSALPGNHALRGVWGDGQGIVWAVSSGGSVLRWDGNAWTEHVKGLGALSTIWGSGPTDLWLVASNGTVYHGTGASSAEVAFAPVVLPGDVQIPIKSIGGTGPNDVWAVGGLKDESDWPWQWKGRVLHYDGDAASGGSGWTLDDELSSRSIACASVAAGTSSGVWIIGQEFRQDTNELLHGVLLRRAPGAADWTNVDRDDGDRRVGEGHHRNERQRAAIATVARHEHERWGDLQLVVCPAAGLGPGGQRCLGHGHERGVGRRQAGTRDAMDWHEVAAGRHSRDEHAGHHAVPRDLGNERHRFLGRRRQRCTPQDDGHEALRLES